MHLLAGETPALFEAPPRGLAILPLPPPSAALRYCVVVPARDEEAALPALVAALAAQVGSDGNPWDRAEWEIVLLLNNCRDRSGEVARAAAMARPELTLHVAEIELAAHEAHVGRARQLLFDTAASRCPSGVILTTDADTIPAPDWIAETAREISAGADCVGGRVLLHAHEQAALPPPVRRLFLLDIGYRRALEEMRALYAPEAHDPFPRHHQHFGGSLAVTAAAYRAAGGMPLARSSEDVALCRAILETGGRIRHSHRVRAHTSARFVGRASGGLADALVWWKEQASHPESVQVESACAAERRLASLGWWQERHPCKAPPAHLCQPPEPPRLDEMEAVAKTLCALRVANERLRKLSLPERLESARARYDLHDLINK